MQLGAESVRERLKIRQTKRFNSVRAQQEDTGYSAVFVRELTVQLHRWVL
ncbi:MAG TPA: hypothetical protein VMD03_07465 [Steroidobacteraceae bacterium]|nr:hypothetical protein [Steroidobacteraceae bacterium]